MASKNAPAAHQKHLAVLIDPDNAPAAIVEGPSTMKSVAHIYAAFTTQSCQLQTQTQFETQAADSI